MVSRRRGPRRHLAWHDKLISFILTDTAQSQADLLPNLALEDREGCTVTRVIYDIWYHISHSVITPVGQIVDVGIGIFDAEASAGGVVPDPDTEIEQPAIGWLYRGRAFVNNLDSVAGGRYFPGHLAGDIRAMRKLGPRVELMMITDNNTDGQASGATMRAVGIVRTLCMLP